MAEFPALHIFVDALMLDAGYLSDEEFGAYMRLLMIEWVSPKCKLPNDDKWLANRLQKTLDQIKNTYRPVIEKFFETDGNWIFQGRLLKEFKYRRQQSVKQSVKAKSRWNNDKVSSHGNAASGNAPHPTPPHPLSSKDKSLLDNTFSKKGAKHGTGKQKSGWIAEGDRLAEKYLAEEVVESGQGGTEQGHGESVRIAAPIRKNTSRA